MPRGLSAQLGISQFWWNPPYQLHITPAVLKYIIDFIINIQLIYPIFLYFTMFGIAREEQQIQCATKPLKTVDELFKSLGLKELVEPTYKVKR